MAFAHSVTRVTISGTMFGGAEQWSTGFYLGEEGSDVSNPTTAAAEAIGARWQTYFTSAGASIANDYLTTQVKMAQMDASGATDLDNVVYYNYTTPPAGANAATQYPPQISLAVTLKSALTRGLAAKGRMYLPGVCHPVDTNGKIASATVGAHATLLQTMFDGINTDVGIAGRLILASKGRTTVPTSPPVNAEVTSLALGDVFDTQRRRRNALVETYVQRAIA